MDFPTSSNTSHESVGAGNAALRFGRGEWAGAFGDLGTLVPFLLAYVTIVGIQPTGMLLAFGVALIAVGGYYRTPFPVQPMKAIGIFGRDRGRWNPRRV